MNSVEEGTTKTVVSQFQVPVTVVYHLPNNLTKNLTAQSKSHNFTNSKNIIIEKQRNEQAKTRSVSHNNS